MDSDEARGASAGFAREEVPADQRHSAWSIFFIIASSVCALPVFILGTRVVAALGSAQALVVVPAATAILALLGGVGAAVGALTGRSLAMLSELAFGIEGAKLVKLLIAVSLAGWFGVNVSVLGATAGEALSAMLGRDVAPWMVTLPASTLIAWVAIRGFSGMHQVGRVLVPLALVLLAASLYLVRARFAAVMAMPGTGAFGVSEAVSAIVGSYIVGALIQPDYGRFVRRPAMAFAGVACALGLVFPLMLLGSAVAPLAVDKPDLVVAMVALGLAVPALAVLMLGAWIDSSACLYSASLSLASLARRPGFRAIVVLIAVIGVILSLLGAERYFVPFLMVLGIGLPPVAAVQIFYALRWPKGEPAARLRWAPLVAWAVGVGAGVASPYVPVPTGIAALDSILAGLAAAIVLEIATSRSARKAAIQSRA